MSRTIEVSEETYEKIREQLKVDERTDLSSLQDMVGKKFFIRTVTYHLVGKVTAIVGDFAKLETASWVANSGVFSEAIKKGTLSEVEPVGEAFVNLKSVTDMFPWHHDLPTKQI